MSKGLGTRQRLFLAAIADLEAERPLGADRAYRVSTIVERVYQLATDLQERQELRDDEREAARQRLWTEAHAGDERAMRLLELSMLIEGSRRHYPRLRGKAPASVERDINPSRVLASLAARGFVQRWRGAYRLTDAGRAVSVGKAART